MPSMADGIGSVGRSFKRALAGVTGLNCLSRVAALVLTAVLICATLFNIEAARVTLAATRDEQTAHLLDDSFAAARYEVGAEESLERKYRLEPSADVFRLHRASAASLTSAMRAILAIGDERDRAIARDVLRDHKKYLSGTQKMFAAVNRRDLPRVIAIDHGIVDPVFDRIERTVRQRAQMHVRVANSALARLGDTQQRIIVITMALSALGLLALGAFLAVLIAYQRRLEASHRAELKFLGDAALVDNLTGIGNHRAYQEDFGREVSRAQRYDETLSLAVLDIDEFKVINDINGHLHGDEVLKALATLLRTLRTEDRPYRLGGDEFAVLLPHTSADEAMETMQRLRTSVSASVFGATVSIGIATMTGAACDLEVLQAQADAAMYSGKRSGRNDATAFDSTMGAMWPLSPKKIHSLRELIAGGEMVVAFQPIWDVEKGRALAFEALARPDAKYGFDGPQEAFDLAERIGRAHELDAVCRTAALKIAGDCLPPDALLFLNVSPQSLDHGRLDPAGLIEAVRAVGLAPDRVVIEITERSITRVDAVIHAAEQLQSHGFRLALDDTGAGNSGLEILSRLTFEFVKIDREVIVKALHDKNARGVLAGIVAIADTTDAYVIAEGIENKEMLDFVCHMSDKIASKRAIHGVQGYLLRRPSDTFPNPAESDDIKALLKEFAVNRPRVATS